VCGKEKIEATHDGGGGGGASPGILEKMSQKCKISVSTCFATRCLDQTCRVRRVPRIITVTFPGGSKKTKFLRTLILVGFGRPSNEVKSRMLDGLI